MRKLHMKRSYKILPIYTGDVSGVCSALYELGGMVVMHDPSGCNSTYNTHDEIRWYHQDSRIFLSGLTEIDAITGNDQKLIRDVCDTAEEVKPKFIALAGSPIPFLTGTDLPAIAQIIEKKTGIPCFSISTNGTHDYVYGAGEALSKVAKCLLAPKPQRKMIQRHTVNLLGVTPLDFGGISHVENMKNNLEKYGWKTLSCWAMGDDLETLSHAGEAEVNLVVSSVGIKVAEILEETYGTPWVAGTPYEDYAEQIAKALEKKEKLPYIKDRENRESCSATKVLTLIGEPITMCSLAAAIEKNRNIATRVLCPLEVSEKFLSAKDTLVCGEEEIEEALADAEMIAADPLYKSICPKRSEFYELPHIAFSGRIFLKTMPESIRVK